MLHVRFEGRSYDLDPQLLGPADRRSDEAIKRRLADHFEVAPERFDFYVIDRPHDSQIVVRPEAVYG